jgi:tRNA A37 N6-isopentenylltransferase MiaA
MAKAKKIKKEELQRLNSIVETMSKIEIALGKITVQQSKALADYNAYEAALKEEQKSLEESYGDVTIDLSTGEYTANEKSEMAVVE